MADQTITTAAPALRAAPDAVDAKRAAAIRKRFPSVVDLRRGAKRRIPRFAFDYLDGYANDELCGARNEASLQGIELLPRYSVEIDKISFETELFGRSYAAPFGIAPMGSPGAIWPGAELHIAPHAQRRRIPYTLATPTNATIEEVARLAPDVFWYQLYRFPRNDHAIALDLVRRADHAGAHVLMMTVDTPLGLKRPRDIRNGVSIREPFKADPRTLYEIATSPGWLMKVWERGVPQLNNIAPYATGSDRNSIAAVMSRENGGSHRWDEIARMRDRWKKPLVLKGIMHPHDAERAVSLGVDGILVSNHGGRNFDGAPATIDLLPAVVAAVGGRATVLFDSGVRKGLDVVRAVALGAKAAFIGRPILFGLGALGDDGARYVMDMFLEELKGEFSHLGATSVADLAKTDLRHPTAWRWPAG